MGRREAEAASSAFDTTDLNGLVSPRLELLTSGLCKFNGSQTSSACFAGV